MQAYSEIKAALDEIFEKGLKDQSAAFVCGVFEQMLAEALLELSPGMRKNLIARARAVVKLD